MQDELARLRARIARIERRTRIGSDARALPAPAGLAERLPGGGILTGAAYALDGSMPLLTALLAEPSRIGVWCAVVGMPEFGVEHAAASGVDLERLVLVPHPGDRWLGVVAALVDAVGVVAVRPGGRAGDARAARLAARLRERQSTLLVEGAWPGVAASLAVTETTWSGLGAGHGFLDRVRMTVAIRTSQHAAKPALAAVG